MGMTTRGRICERTVSRAEGERDPPTGTKRTSTVPNWEIWEGDNGPDSEPRKQNLIPSIAQEQQTVDCRGEAQRITIGGRHDICAIPRIVPVLKAMALLTLADFVLLQRRVGRP